ncbi:mitochondrial chaperone BCS1 [Histoplasma capsulatum H143]|uniref:Mitochondrial chaperone BCS1 n=1 Tax=Ajellomyces capsulatus (strain H143) TaxID=544712 RepID=C6HC97_AJECH|nr:mitochondrial chaperone BCS1 [Histoplasma capsulatum H143]
MSGNDADRGISKGMEVTGPALAQPTNHNDLIVPAKAQQQLSNLSSDVGLFSQLASNPFFTAVCSTKALVLRALELD